MNSFGVDEDGDDGDEGEKRRERKGGERCGWERGRDCDWGR